MTKNNFSYSTRRGNTTFIVNVKQAENAKKPLDTLFQDICRHEVSGDFVLNNPLILENKQKSS